MRGLTMMMVLVREKVVHIGRQYTNGSWIWQGGKLPSLLLCEL